jgi:membrane protein
VFGQQGLITDAATYLKDAGAPRETVDAVIKALQSAQDHRGTAIVALVIGLATSLNGASGAFGAAGRALNKIFRVQEGRGFVRHKLNDLLWTLIVSVLGLVTFVLLFLGGGLARDVLGKIGLGDTAASIWLVVRWPAALAVAMMIYAIVYYAAPNVEVRKFRWITPGAIVGVVLWILASAAFFVYVSNFSS